MIFSLEAGVSNILLNEIRHFLAYGRPTFQKYENIYYLKSKKYRFGVQH
jgi:hypothetical protein